MNTKFARFIVLLGALVLATCSLAERRFPVLEDDGSSSDRRILVTFVDRTMDRRVWGNPLAVYRAGDAYASSGWSRRVARRIARQNALKMLAQWPVTELGVSCVVYTVPRDVEFAAVIETVQRDSAVHSVQRMNRFETLAQHNEAESAEGESATATYDDPYLPLQNGFAMLDIAHWHRSATGRGVSIALVDTGVDLAHPDLEGQIRRAENMAPGQVRGGIADRHGTAVAGVLSARPDNGIGIAGIAPEADVVVLRACWPEQPGALSARCNSFTLALALNEAIRMRSRIINLSLSGPEDPLLGMLIGRAIERGIVVVAAVPASGEAAGFPASQPGVLAVGSGVEKFRVEIVAPGTDILTTVPSDTYDFMSGSSFAAPHVAGLAALMLQLHPRWNANEIRIRLADPDGPMARVLSVRHD